MPDFTFPNDSFSRTAMRCLLVLQLAAMVVVLRLSRNDGFFLPVIICFLTFLLLIAVVGWLYLRYQALPVVRQKKELERLVLKFEKNLQAEAKKIQSFKRERDQLFRAEKEEIKATLRSLQREYIENGLAEASLKDASIQGLGPKLKERLAEYGIQSAAQVKDQSIELPGFGETKRQALLNWRSSVLTHLESAKPAALSRKQAEIIKQNYQVFHDKNNAAERKAIHSQQILEYELISLKPRLRQFASVRFLGYLSHSLASRGVVAALIALVLIVTQVVTTVSATGSVFIASISTLRTSSTSTLTSTLASTSTVTDIPTATRTPGPRATDTPSITAALLPTRTTLPTLTSLPLLPTLDSLQGVTAICNDGSYSYSGHSRGTCSHHGGVKQWIHKPPN